MTEQCGAPAPAPHDAQLFSCLQFYELAARGGHGTLCMFGQTGSGAGGLCLTARTWQRILRQPKQLRHPADSSLVWLIGKTYTMGGILRQTAANIFGGQHPPPPPTARAHVQKTAAH